jgi:hypothetical protein
MSSMFSNLSKFIDQVDASVGEIVQQNTNNNNNNNNNFSLPPPPSSLSATTTTTTTSVPFSPPNQEHQHSRRSSNSSSSHSNHHQQHNNNQIQEQSFENRDSNSLQLQHDFDIAISRLKQSTSENQFLHHQVETLRAQSDESKTKITQLESKLQKFSEIQSQQSHAKQQVEEELRHSHHQVEALQKENQILSTKAALAEESLSAAMRDAQKSKALASARILELEQTGEVEEKLATLEAEISVLKKSLENVRNERDLAQKKLQEENSSKKRENNINNHSHESSNNNNTHQEAHQKQIDELHRQISSLKKEQEDERNSHRSTRARFEQMLSEKVEEVAILEKQLSRLTNTNNNNNNNNISTNLNNNNLIGNSQPEIISTNSSEWEKRAKDLADLVMEKQAALELKRNESDQWRSRYETAQQRLREAELMAAVSSNSKNTNNHHRAITINDSSEFSGGAGDENDISKNVLVAMLTRSLGTTKPYVVAGVGFLRKIDQAVQRVVSGLKRNSLLRLVVAFYIFLVHLWILILIWNAPLPAHDASSSSLVNGGGANVANTLGK